MPATSRTLLAVLSGLALAAAAAVVGVMGLRGEETGRVVETPAASWAPAPRRVGGVSVVATAGDGRYALHTKHGDVPFLAGVNLGATTLGHQPG